MQIDGSFYTAYRKLEERMKALAETDGDIYVPNPEPEGPVQYVLICMEPSLGRWARTPAEAKRKLDAGFRNFIGSIDTCILHFCVRRFLCRPGQRYHITDFSKGAMLVAHAGIARARRYEKWYSLLKDEINLVAAPDARIIAVGKIVAQQLERNGFCGLFTQVLHYSGQAASARKAGIVGREDDFHAFKGSVSLEDLKVTIEDVMKTARVPAAIGEEARSKVARSQLTTSRLLVWPCFC